MEFEIFCNITLGLRHGEILQNPPLQRDPRGAERRQHVPGGSSSLLHQREGLQHHGGFGQLPPHCGPGRQAVRLLLLVERLLHSQGEDHIINQQTLTVVSPLLNRLKNSRGYKPGVIYARIFNAETEHQEL